MHKTLMAFMAAMLIATSPICADITSTDSNTTVTASNDISLSQEMRWKLQDAESRKADAEWRKQVAASQAAAKKTMIAFIALFGAGAMAHGHWHYNAVTPIYNAASPFTALNLSVVQEQSMAYTSEIAGAVTSAMAAILYYFLPEPSTDEQV
jgi:hypothetical protein